MKGLVSKIQHYSTKDGPGIRSTVFMTGCNLRCLWCANPESMLPGEKLMYHPQKCQKCMTCVSLFPDAVKMTENGCVIEREKADFDDLVNICPFDAYEKMGSWMDSDELISLLVHNREFYESSNGGVTFSGGEGLLQVDFIEECIDKLHDEGISVCIDTAGNVSWNKAESVLKKCDIILYDVKTFNSDLHRKLTGCDNRLILDNLSRIDALDKELYVRMIIVPGLNDSLEDLRGRVDLVRNLKSLIQIDFLKYHNLGEGKYRKLGIEYPLKDIGEFSEEILENIIEYAGSIRTTIGG